MTEKHEKGHLDPGMVKNAGRGELEHQPDDNQLVMRRGADDHRFADKTAEQREGRDGGRADDAEQAGQRHGLVEPAQIGAADFPGHLQHRTCRHE